MGLTMVRSQPDDPASEPMDVPAAGLGQLIADEVFAQAAAEEALSFFVAVGTRIAASHALPEDADLAGLARAINEVWRELGLGEVSLLADTDGIVIDHHGHSRGSNLSSVWPGAAGAMLRGAYEAWFESIGGPALQTRLIRGSRNHIMLHHGL